MNNGQIAEYLRVKHLPGSGYSVLARNRLNSRYVIDIIATKNDTLHFIEVKSLRSSEQVYPHEHVTTKKYLSMKEGASTFLL